MISKHDVCKLYQKEDFNAEILWRTIWENTKEWDCWVVMWVKLFIWGICRQFSVMCVISYIAPHSVLQICFFQIFTYSLLLYFVTDILTRHVLLWLYFSFLILIVLFIFLCFLPCVFPPRQPSPMVIILQIYSDDPVLFYFPCRLDSHMSVSLSVLIVV